MRLKKQKQEKKKRILTRLLSFGGKKSQKSEVIDRNCAPYHKLLPCVKEALYDLNYVSQFDTYKSLENSCWGRL